MVAVGPARPSDGSGREDGSDTPRSRRAPRVRLEQHRAVVTRHGLLVAAGERFAEVGYHGASLREILAACGVTKGALYFHFSGKQDLVDAIIADTVATWSSVSTGIESQGFDPLEALIASIEEVFGLITTDPIVRGAVRLLNDPGVPPERAREHYEQAEAFVATHLASAAEAELLKPTTDVSAIAGWIIATIAGHRLICDRTRALDELPDRIAQMWRTLLPLIATEPWLRCHGWRTSGDRGDGGA